MSAQKEEQPFSAEIGSTIHVRCPKCDCDVLASNAFIHSVRCRGLPTAASTDISKEGRVQRRNSDAGQTRRKSHRDNLEDEDQRHSNLRSRDVEFDPAKKGSHNKNSVEKHTLKSTAAILSPSLEKDFEPLRSEEESPSQPRREGGSDTVNFEKRNPFFVDEDDEGKNGQQNFSEDSQRDAASYQPVPVRMVEGGGMPHPSASAGADVTFFHDADIDQNDEDPDAASIRLALQLQEEEYRKRGGNERERSRGTTTAPTADTFHRPDYTNHLPHDAYIHPTDDIHTNPNFNPLTAGDEELARKLATEEEEAAARGSGGGRNDANARVLRRGGLSQTDGVSSFASSTASAGAAIPPLLDMLLNGVRNLSDERRANVIRYRHEQQRDGERLDAYQRQQAAYRERHAGRGDEPDVLRRGGYQQNRNNDAFNGAFDNNNNTSTIISLLSANLSNRASRTGGPIGALLHLVVFVLWFIRALTSFVIGVLGVLTEAR